MPAVLNHWVVATEVARQFIDRGDHAGLFQGSQDDRAQITYKEHPFTDDPSLKEIGVSKFLYMGSNGPDIPYAYHVTIPEAAASSVFDSLRPGLSHVADLLHYNKPNEFALELVRAAKSVQSSDPARADHIMAFALGFATHLAVDAFLHPYINCFAGTYHDQTVPELHRTSEVHQDSWLARSYFGRKSIAGGGSWTVFLPDNEVFDRTVVMRGGVVTKQMKANPVLKVFFGDLAEAFGKTYGPESAVDGGYFIESYDNYYTKFIATDYNAALLYVPQEPHVCLVFHRLLNAKNVYLTDLIMKQAVPAAVDACKAILTLYDDQSGFSDNALNAFRSDLKNWNLDMGYWIDVELVGNQLKIIWRHTWFGKNLSGQPHA